ncbi:type II secretion system GspH family protein [Candidatus Gracilibacteria bacterium]|nr:type II secretion system GspH family protein [Candidatus Gracilibacteria bacterium]
MSNTSTKTSLRGFTLIELLVVIAIIGLLSTAIMGPVQTGLKKGRDTRKISDITQVQGALLQYAGDNNGIYPPALTALSPTYMAIAANMLATATSGLNAPASRDRFMYVTYSDTSASSSRVQYHLGVALENQNASLQGDEDCYASTTQPGVIDDPTGSACASGLGDGVLVNTNWVVNGAGLPAASDAGEDFGGAGNQEAALGVCTSKLDTCIFDIIPK